MLSSIQKIKNQLKTSGRGFTYLGIFLIVLWIISSVAFSKGYFYKILPIETYQERFSSKKEELSKLQATAKTDLELRLFNSLEKMYDFNHQQTLQTTHFVLSTFIRSTLTLGLIILLFGRILNYFHKQLIESEKVNE